ncbi:MAG: SCO family protein [Gammaproteobacteria bacterium]|nr:SCO family protein [Gammaproteobacteria bacterium]MDH5594958.1 SCO family protein [Gammaproteobacteria bacterium]MDH5613550.1 SCO family protein [Gammaproteobacteria bacterium]
MLPVRTIKQFIFGYLVMIAPMQNVFAVSNPAMTESTIDPSVMAIDEQEFLGTPLDQKDYTFIDHQGQEFTLQSVMGDKPLIILFSYFTCDGVCSTINRHAMNMFKKIERKVGKDFRILTISFDKNDTLQSMHHFVSEVGVPEDMQEGWKFALLKNPEDITKLTGHVGVRFFWSSRDKVFLHPNAFIFISPEKRVVRYLYGSAFAEKDIELALIDTDWNKISESKKLIDILAGVCFSYNFEEGKYTVNIPLVVGLGSLLGGILLVVLSFTITKKRKSRRMHHA